jgi:hypothetical protein
MNLTQSGNTVSGTFTAKDYATAYNVIVPVTGQISSSVLWVYQSGSGDLSFYGTVSNGVWTGFVYNSGAEQILMVCGAANIVGTFVGSHYGPPFPGLAFASAVASGGSLVASGSGAGAGGRYTVVTSTNAALPSGSWTPLLTNAFSTDGSFSFTNAISASVPQRFFRIQVP